MASLNTKPKFRQLFLTKGSDLILEFTAEDLGFSSSDPGYFEVRLIIGDGSSSNNGRGEISEMARLTSPGRFSVVLRANGLDDVADYTPYRVVVSSAGISTVPFNGRIQRKDGF